MPERKTRVLLADDHAILRRGVRMMLEQESDIEVVGEAKTGKEALEEARINSPDIVVMDLSMPEMNGIEATRRIVDELVGVHVICLSMHRDSVYVREILKAGAKGYLVKDSEEDELLRAIRAVRRGEAFLSPAVSEAVLTDYRKHVSNPVDLLTNREREVLTRIADGKTNKDIAVELNLSVYTIESHRKSVMEKLNLHNTGDIVRFALRNGLMS